MVEPINENTSKSLGTKIYKYNWCQLSQKFMENPVMTEFGTVFEKEAIEKLMQEENCKDPIENKPYITKKLEKCEFMIKVHKEIEKGPDNKKENDNLINVSAVNDTSKINNSSTSATYKDHFFFKTNTKKLQKPQKILDNNNEKSSSLNTDNITNKNNEADNSQNQNKINLIPSNMSKTGKSEEQVNFHSIKDHSNINQTNNINTNQTNNINTNLTNIIQESITTITITKANLSYSMTKSSIGIIFKMIKNINTDQSISDEDNMKNFASRIVDIVTFINDKSSDLKSTINQINNSLVDEAKNDIITYIENVKYIRSLVPPKKDAIKKESINRLNEEGLNALQIACKRSFNFDFIKYLVEDLGVDYKIKDKQGKSLLYYSIEFCSEEVYNYFISKGLEVTNSDINEAILQNACSNSSLELVEKYVDAFKSKINCFDSRDLTKVKTKKYNNFTLLELAKKNENYDVIKYLLNNIYCSKENDDEEYITMAFMYDKQLHIVTNKTFYIIQENEVFSYLVDQLRKK